MWSKKNQFPKIQIASLKLRSVASKNAWMNYTFGKSLTFTIHKTFFQYHQENFPIYCCLKKISFGRTSKCQNTTMKKFWDGIDMLRQNTFFNEMYLLFFKKMTSNKYYIKHCTLYILMNKSPLGICKYNLYGKYFFFIIIKWKQSCNEEHCQFNYQMQQWRMLKRFEHESDRMKIGRFLTANIFWGLGTL